MSTEVAPLTVEELLARSKVNADAKKAVSGGSKIQQMLAGYEDSDTIDLSPVAKLLKASKDQNAAKPVPYTEQDWYVTAKVAQLKGQIEIYSNLPGLDPSGAIMDQLTKEVNELVSKQQAKLKKSTDEAAKKQAELDALEAEKANAPLSVEDMLKNAKNRANGIEPSEPLSKEAQALLDKSKGAVVDQTA